MSELLHALLPVLSMGVVFSPIVFVLIHARRTRQKFIDALADDKEVNAALVGNSGMMRVFTIGERWRTNLTCYVPGGKETTWTVRARPPSFSARTTLSLRREGFGGFLRERLFDRHDIHVGDATFDDELNIGGSDPAVVRAIFARPDLRIAVLRAFRDLHIASIAIDTSEASVLVYKTTTTPEEAKRVLFRLSDLFEALDGASNVAALPPPSSDDVVQGPAASSESGAPVAVPLR